MSYRTAAIGAVCLLLSGPAVPAAAGPESDGELTGTVQRISIDLAGGGGFTITAIVPQGGPAVRVADDPRLAAVATGQEVSVTLAPFEAVSQQVAADGGAVVLDVEPLAGPQVLASEPPIAAGEPIAHPVHLRTGLISGQASDGVTAATVAADVTDEVAPYWSDSTEGAIAFSVASQDQAGTYSGWGSTATCYTAQILNILDWVADDAGIVYNDGTHALLYTPELAACPFAGVAHVADGGATWINGTQGDRAWTMTHEVGHTLGLGHSNSRYVCAFGAQDGSSASCLDGPYGDAYDAMGLALGGPGPLNGGHLSQLGLLTPANSVEAVGATTVTLAPVGSLAGLRFLTFTSGDAVYHVEYRGAVGRDADLAVDRLGCPTGANGCTPTRYVPGVVVRRWEMTPDAPETFLLNASGTSNPWFALRAGERFTTADGGYNLDVWTITDEGATMQLYAPGSAPNACPAGTIAEDGFLDTAGPMEAAIDCLWHWQVTGGTGNGLYSPTRPVTREQMAAFIARLIMVTGGTLPEDPVDAFGDDEDSIFELPINQLAAAGITGGNGPGEFGPRDLVNRAQMAAFITRAYDYRAAQGGLAALPAGADYFPDDEGLVLEAAINKAAAAEFAFGFSDGTFGPHKAVRRDHMAAFLTRTLDLMVRNELVEVPPAP